MIENLKEGSRGNLTSVTNIVQVIFVAFKIYTGVKSSNISVYSIILFYGNIKDQVPGL